MRTRRIGWTRHSIAALVMIGVAALGCGACFAQETGEVTVWVVGKARAPKTNLQAINELHHATPLTYQEQTSGSFGQSASTFGQNSGSYGVPSDSASISTPKEAPGENAPAPAANGSGYHQQDAGSFGQTASSAGTNAGNYGQTSGSFGQTAGSYGTNAGGYGGSASTLGRGAGSSNVQSGRNAAPRILWIDLRGTARQEFQKLEVRFFDVYPDELRDRLAAAQGTADAPDVLLGAVPEPWAAELRNRFLVETIQPAVAYADGLGEVEAWPKFWSPMSLTLHAPHREAARALMLWASEEAGSGCVDCLPGDAARLRQYVGVAVSAVTALLHGLPLGDLADPEMAAFPVSLGKLVLTTTANTLVDGGSAHVEVIRASRNGRLAVVTVRVVAASDRVYGVAHPLVVLRQGSDGQWKVLHVSLNLPVANQERVRQALMNTSPTSVAEQNTGVVGVTLAVPADGDPRSPMPELGWDNGGGAGLQVVEWQRAYSTGAGEGWTDARLYLVPDEASRLKTQVTAEFAIYQARYRWRVWSVGAQGETKISPWRTMNIVP